MTSYAFIVNPVAGKGAGGKLAERLRSDLRKRGVPHDILYTTGPGDATTAARSSMSDVVVAMGGDGTINEVVNGLAGSQRALGILPAGSGNDFIKSVDIPAGLDGALDTLFADKRRVIDVGHVTCAKNGTSGVDSERRLFINGVGIGFDASVAARTRQIPYLSGTLLYVMAVMQTLGRYTPPLFSMSFGGVQRESRNLLIAVGNGRCAGGGFYLTPDAVVDDGLLDICAVEEKTIAQILSLMPKVMRGRHHGVPGVNFYRSNELAISAKDGFYVHADGEIVGENVNRVQIGLELRSLAIVAG